MQCRDLACAFLAMLMGPAPAAADPALHELLKRPQYESLSLSPRGDYLAAQVPLDDRTVLAIVRRSDMKITAQIDPGQDGFVDSSFWVSDTRLFASTSMRFGSVTQPYSLGSLYSVDVDGKNRRSFGGNVIDPLLDDPSQLLVSQCYKRVGLNCLTRVQRVRKDGLGRAVNVVDTPIANGQFLADRHGEVRFSWATDDEDIQRLFIRKDGAWIALNDEAHSGVEVAPLGISYDGKSGFLLSERRKGTSVIERVDLASLQRIVVAEDPALDPTSLVWSLDGREPIGATFGTSVPKLTFFDQAHPHVALIRELEKAFPGEFAEVTSTSRDGRSALVTVRSDREPGRFYLLDTTSGDLALLARSRPWLDAARMARSEEVSVPARDGLLLRGYLTRPLASAARPPALVVLAHGGPFGIRDAWAFDEEVQMLAARGYVVLRINFRGSGGHGRDFVEAGYQQWGRKMQDDLTDATRWTAANAGIDPDRICMWGASYGGYAALMGAVREPKLYRCVVGMAGPYDLPTLYKWGDTQRSRWGKRWLETSLGGDQKRLLESSPTRHADKIEARVLLVQGGRDQRVSSEHVKAMKRALAEAGKQYEGYFPPDETHGFFRESSRREYYTRVLQFIDRSIGLPENPSQ